MEWKTRIHSVNWKITQNVMYNNRQLILKKIAGNIFIRYDRSDKSHKLASENDGGPERSNARQAFMRPHQTHMRTGTTSQHRAQ